ncbi:integrase [Enterococcus sp. JM4C]|uniref:tyrosine-type recombinase/integrase n=1 Tax=Candidatus Enterococcus huntleyi TaxID=1857217 RepID=UPI00137A52D1|nr:site-specific integrase [Enterococcus sp. JM4C]KAF1295091.1 integrase [Enterococcus sp. JM4C]
MATIKSYIKKDGTKAYLFQTYLGVDPVTGKEKRTTRRNFATKKDAQLALAKLVVETEKNGLHESSKKIKTFKILYELWFEQHKKDIKPTTEQRIKIYFDNHILKKLGKMKLSKITPLYCQKILNEWADSLATYKQMRIYVSMVFKYGILIGAIDDNPMERTIVPKRKMTSNKEESDSYYTKEELQEFLSCLKQLNDNRSYTFFRVLAFVGLRKGEALALTWNDIDFENRLININKTLAELKNGKPIIQDTKTDSSNRVVQMDRKTCNILREYKNHIIKEKFALGIRDENFNNNVVFSNSVLYRENQYLYKAYPNHVMEKVKRHFPDMKIIKVHDFRKTNASLLFESGASIKDVSQRLGHKSTKITTDIYIKVTKAKQNETAEKFSEYMAF